MNAKLKDHPDGNRDLTEAEIEQMKVRIKELGITKSQYLKALVLNDVRRHRADIA